MKIASGLVVGGPALHIHALTQRRLQRFDCQAWYSTKFIEQKLTYMHLKGPYHFAGDFAYNPYSSVSLFFPTGANVYKQWVRGKMW